MGNYIGDFPTGATVRFMWNTNGADGASITRATDGTLVVYKNLGTTQRSSLNGITQTEDFDGLTGVHAVAIDLTDNTDAGFWAAGNEYSVAMSAMTIDGKTVNAEIASFSIERSGGVLALFKSQIIGTLAAGTHNAQGGDAFARLGAPTGASISADIVAVKAETAAILTDTGTDIPAQITAVDDYIDTEVAAIKGVTDKLDTAMEVDGGVYRFTTNALEQGPVGGGLDAAGVRAAVGLAAANLDTQIGAIDDYLDTEVAAIKAKTDNLPASPAAVGSAMTLTAAYDAAKTASQAGDAMTLTAAYDDAKTAAQAGDVMSTTYAMRKNTQLAAFPFEMYSATGVPTAGLTVTATRSIDGAAFGACANAVAEVGSGAYKITLAAADLNGDTVMLKFTAAGAATRLIPVVTQS